MLPVVYPAAPCIYCLRDIKGYELVRLNYVLAIASIEVFMGSRPSIFIFYVLFIFDYFI